MRYCDLHAHVLSMLSLLPIQSCKYKQAIVKPTQPRSVSDNHFGGFFFFFFFKQSSKQQSFPFVFIQNNIVGLTHTSVIFIVGNKKPDIRYPQLSSLILRTLPVRSVLFLRVSFRSLSGMKRKINHACHSGLELSLGLAVWNVGPESGHNYTINRFAWYYSIPILRDRSIRRQHYRV